MNYYRTIDNISEYVKKMIESGVQIIIAEKNGKIAAHLGTVGERVVSYSVDAEGCAVVEKDAVVKLDDEGIPGWIATKIDDSGEVVIDNNGHINQWIIENSVLSRKYVETEYAGIYKPAGEIQKFLQIEEAIHIVQWGEEMNVDCGGYINITDPEDIYVISGRDFEQTYRVLRE